MAVNSITNEFSAFLKRQFGNKNNFLHSWLDKWSYELMEQEAWYNSRISETSIFLQENKLDEVLIAIEADQQQASSDAQKQQVRENGKDYLFFLLHLYIASAKSNNTELQQKIETTLRKLVNLFPSYLKHLALAEVNDTNITKEYQNNGINYAFARPLLRNALSYTEFDKLITQYNNLFFEHLTQANKDGKSININRWVSLLNDLKNLQEEIAEANPGNENNNIAKSRINALINTCSKAIPDLSKKLGINKVPDFLDIDFNKNWGDLNTEVQSNQVNLNQIEANKDILAKHSESFISVKKEIIDKLVSTSNDRSQESLVDIDNKINRNSLFLNTINNSNDWLISHNAELNAIENFKNSLNQQHAFYMASLDELNSALTTLQKNYEIEKSKIDDYRDSFTNLTVDDNNKISAKKEELDKKYSILKNEIQEKINTINTAIETISDQLAALPTIQKLKRVIIDTVNVEQEALAEKKSTIQNENELQEALNIELPAPMTDTNQLLSTVSIRHEQLKKNINTSYASYVNLQQVAIKNIAGLNPDYKVSLTSINNELEKCKKFTQQVDQFNNFSPYNEQIEKIYGQTHQDLDNLLIQLTAEDEKLKNNISSLNKAWDDAHDKINNIINNPNIPNEEKIALHTKQDDLEKKHQQSVSEISKQQQKVLALKASIENEKKAIPDQEIFKNQVKNHVENQIISLNEARKNLLSEKEEFNKLRKSMASNISILKSEEVPNPIIDIKENLEEKINSINASMQRLESLSFKGVISEKTNKDFELLTKKIASSNQKIMPIISQMNDLRKQIEDGKNKNFKKNVSLTGLERFSAPASPERERLLDDSSIDEISESRIEYAGYNEEIESRNKEIETWKNSYKKLEEDYNNLLIENKDDYAKLAAIQSDLTRKIEQVVPLNQKIIDARARFEVEKKSIASSFQQLNNKKEETKSALITLAENKNKFIANLDNDKSKITDKNSDLPAHIQTAGENALNNMKENANKIVKSAIEVIQTGISAELKTREKIIVAQTSRKNELDLIPPTFENYCKRNHHASFDEYVKGYEQLLNKVEINFSAQKFNDRKAQREQHFYRCTKDFSKLSSTCTKINTEFTNTENEAGFQNKQKQVMDNLRNQSQQLDKTVKSRFRGLLGGIGGTLGGLIVGFAVGGPFGAIIGVIAGAAIGGGAGFGLSYAFSTEPSASSFAVTSLQPAPVSENIIEPDENSEVNEINLMFQQEPSSQQQLPIPNNIIEGNLNEFLSNKNKNHNTFNNQPIKSSSNSPSALYQPVNKKSISEKELTLENFDELILGNNHDASNLKNGIGKKQ